MYRLWKKGSIIEIIVPRFKELLVENVWKFVAEIDKLKWYFSDFKSRQFSNCDFMFSILATFKGDLLKRTINNTKRFSAINVSEDENEFIYIFYIMMRYKSNDSKVWETNK